MRTFLRIARLSSQYKNRMTKGSSITGKHCKFIMFLYHHEGCTQDEIAASMGVDKSNAARRLSELEDKGYIERKVKKEDKRNLEIYPTEKLKAIYPYVKNILMSWDDYVMEDLSEEEKEMFYSILDKMKEKADKWQEHDFKLPEMPKEMKE